MTLAITDLTLLDEADVAENFDTLTQMLQEAFPDVDLKRGVVSDLVLHLASILTTANQADIELVTKSSSILEINQDPTLATDEVLDNLLSNYRLTRLAASKAAGDITIVLSAQIPTTIGNGALFTASSGLNYVADNVYNARITEETVTGTNDRLLVAVSGGWAFTIGAEAEEEGSGYNLQRDASLTPAIAPSNFVTAYAESDFVGGVNEETNAEIMTRFEEGAAARGWSNRTNNTALIRNEADFANILSISEIGYGDEELLRYNGIFPVAYGGRSDVYARTQALPQVTVLTKTATLVSKVGPLGTWQVSITADDAPGFYRATQVKQTDGTGGYPITLDTRGYNTSATDYPIDVVNALQANYSRYSTAVMRFEDDDTDATGLTVSVATRSYSVYVQAMPLISELQDFVSDRDRRISDVLIKAPVPCLMTAVSFQINRQATDPAPDTAAIKAAVADAVNSTGFSGGLSSSTIAKAVHDETTGTSMTVSSTSMAGTLYKPTGTTTTLSGSAFLTVPDEPENMVTRRTVCFFLDPEDIAITVVEV